MNPMRRPTIKDVAELAKVSLKTVSRVINNEPSVMQATRARVLRAIAELDYEPDPSARNLRSGTPFVIGLVSTTPTRTTSSACRTACWRRAAKPASACRSIPAIPARRCWPMSWRLGAAFAPGRAGADRADVRAGRSGGGAARAQHAAGAHHRRHRRPGRRACVFVDDRDAAYEITEHLIQLGHQRIGFLWGGQSHRSSTERYPATSALKDYGIEPDKHLVVQGDYTFDDGFRGARRLLALRDPPTAIFGSNDEIAAGVLAAAKSAGMNVPYDLSIAGFEDSPFSSSPGRR
jgi:LacI family transcriptional regulator